MKARKGVIYITHPGLFSMWWILADPCFGAHFLLGPILVSWQSVERHKYTLAQVLAGELVAAIGRK